jgi:polyphosphate kinase
LQPSEEGDAVDILGTIRHEDVLVHHPYDSFATSVEEFFSEAAVDPDVLTIKTTLYRTSGDSPIVNSLMRAIERGKQVAVLVELKARFDEAANIEWARALEEAGVHVTYGLMGLKTHTKTALVVRDEPEGLRRYCHIGTGNYNSLTAKIYEDFGLLTADERIGADLSQLFNFLTGYGRNVDYRRLLVAPHSLRPRLLSYIEGETRRGSRGRIVMKMNSLVDPGMIDALYEASQNGVEIDLVVRGICCLRPGVPGLSERIRVRSIVGRYLEHSRIYFFNNGAGKGKPVYYIGSADLMPRNLDHRVEALVPVRDPSIQNRLQEVLDVNLADDVLAWRLDSTGGWHRVCDEVQRDGAEQEAVASKAGDVAAEHHPARVNTHERLQEMALDRSRRAPRHDG